MSTKWHDGPLAGFDLETSGTDVFNDHIVTAAVVDCSPGQRPTSIQWIIDPGVDIPDEAAAVHGWTTERVREAVGGRDQAVRIGPKGNRMRMHREGALGEIAGHLATRMAADAAVVAANAAFDLTLLESELVRHGIDPLSSRPTGIRGVVDPMVIEKAWDPYRKVKGGCRGGKHQCGGCGVEDKTLTSLCKHYGVILSAAHDAAADALAAVRLAPRLMSLWPDSARLRLATLHEHQVTWRREQADGLRAYFDRAGIEHDGVCGEWPVHSVCRPRGVAA